MVVIRMITIVVIASIAIRWSRIMSMIVAMTDGGIIPIAITNIHTVVNVDIGITAPVAIVVANIISAIIHIVTDAGFIPGTGTCTRFITSTSLVTGTRFGSGCPC